MATHWQQHTKQLSINSVLSDASDATLTGLDYNPLTALKVEVSLPGQRKVHHVGEPSRTPRDWRFWCIILSLAVSMLLTAIEFSAIGTALPRIVNDIGGVQFVWVGSAYTLGSTALLPFSGGLAKIFGRRPAMLGGLLVFAVGSAVCATAQGMNWLILGRTVQGLGGGAITALIQIILADLVPLRERGVFNGIMALSWAVGGGIGPVLGGVLAQAGQWRWLFYLNLPICAVAGTLVAVFLRMKIPTNLTLREKLARMDGVGNLIVIASTTAVVIALSWGGLEFAWSSARVLVPLVVGMVGLCGFLVYEATLAKHPSVPISLILVDRTAFSGYAQCFLVGVILAATNYWLPLYFQACKSASPTTSGLSVFGLSLSVSPTAILSGLVIQKTHRYRQPLWAGWAALTLGLGLFVRLDADAAWAYTAGTQVLVGVGIGIVYVSAYFPVLAPVSVESSASALVFFTFLRNFAFVWGVTLGGAILQNELAEHLPPALVARFPAKTEIVFAVVPEIGALDPAMKDAVRAAFARALGVMWRVLVGLSGAGFGVSLAMRRFALHTEVDGEWGRAEEGNGDGGEGHGPVVVKSPWDAETRGVYSPVWVHVHTQRSVEA
ncbi:MFS general substrate transporter [Amylostereum chailletii]|nr:MFS general substrate transporter [Amylostereum chailletii]